ncbi:hypothetical protein [Ekhidna sp.]|uniref:hypothetical protein n=1 Tax=Ekhidna sp. TaxID=2608089 RepID=UPI003299DCF2
MKHYFKIFLVMILGTSAIVAIGQENDDLYFTKKDRVKQKKKFTEVADQYDQQPEQIQDNEELSFLGRQFKESNAVSDEGFVSEESLDYYQPEKTQEDYQIANDYATDSQYQNSNFSNAQETFYDDGVPQQVIVNNYYNDNWNTWNRWNRPRMRFGFGWNSWGGNFWSVSYGNAWGNPWYDPFWDPWYNGWAYNPWGWGGGFYGSYWCPPAYRGYYGRPVYVVDNNSRRGRDVVRGSRNSRGSVSTRSNRSSSGRRASVTSESSGRADYSRQQADYLNRSRSSRYSSGNSRGSSSISSRSSNAENSSRYSSGARTNTNTNFNRSSNSTNNNRSYSPPASRSSRSSSARPSRPSRSSGSTGRSSSSSSSRSSGSRSSSGRSSSSRRGGN